MSALQEAHDAHLTARNRRKDAKKRGGLYGLRQLERAQDLDVSSQEQIPPPPSIIEPVTQQQSVLSQAKVTSHPDGIASPHWTHRQANHSPSMNWRNSRFSRGGSAVATSPCASRSGSLQPRRLPPLTQIPGPLPESESKSFPRRMPSVIADNPHEPPALSTSRSFIS